MSRTTAIAALLTDHQLVNKILEQFVPDNPRFLHIAKTLHRAVSAHAWFEDVIFLPALDGEPRLFKKFMDEIYQEHKDVDALLKLLRKTPESNREDIELYAKQTRVILSTHFRKEEDALFPIAERILSNEGLLELGDEMKRRQIEVRQFVDL